MPLLSRIETEILQLLVAHGEMYGLEMVAASTRLKPGTIYVTLARMDDKGYVTSRTVKSKHESGLPRRLFKITGLGEQTLRISQYAGALLKEATV
jgi:DNA-binding PadR family transcriptional regulator